MRIKRSLFWFGWLAGLLLFVPTPFSLRAQGLTIQARLVWGTDGPKPHDAKLKDIEPDLKRRLSSVFKWKHYFEVNHKEARIPEHGSKRVRMSRQCELLIANDGRQKVEVSLFGQGKKVITRRETLSNGELMVLAGDDKNNTAWFVILAQKKGQ